MKGFGYWLTSVILVLGLLVTACASPKAPAPATERPATAPSAEKPGAPASASLEEAAKKEGEVVVWAHSFQDSDQFVRFFKEKYPFLELKIWNATSNEVINKVLEEAKVGRFSADIVTLTDRDIIKLKDLFLAYEWSATKGWDEVSRPSHNLWRYYVRSAKLPAYNTTLVSAAEAPKSLDDLKDVKWRGKSITSFSNNEL
ncbi:MAG: iron transporter substrate-binding protein, partial [Dehalococcoidia bacterium]|nr:iron transporter substrate-binding protein [Dehalococcoidia bacterium]